MNEQGEKPNGVSVIAYINIVNENLEGDGTWNMEGGIPATRRFKYWMSEGLKKQ